MSQRVQRRGVASSIRRSSASAIRTSDDFVARSLDTTKWQFISAKTGSGSSLAFSTASMVDLVTSNSGNYQNDGAVALYENITPSTDNANSNVFAQFTIPSDGSATFRIVTRMTVVATGRKGYELVLDCGNGQIACNVRNDSYGESQPYKSPAGSYSTNPNTVWCMRLLTATVVNGTRLAGRAWLASAAEPTTWAFDIVDATAGYSTGYVSVWAYPGAATTSYVWKLDQLTISSA